MNSGVNSLLGGIRRAGWTVCLLLAAVAGPPSALSQCDTCTDYEGAQNWGTVTNSTITEASGLAASRRNPGVLWLHNDGSRDRVFAISTNGTVLASFNLGMVVQDMEDAAVAPLPSGGAVVYFGDIGASSAASELRRDLRLIRVTEPQVDLAWASDPKSGSMSGAEVITLRYPDGSYDAEALMADPRTGDVYVATKQDGFTRLYRAAVSGATNQALVQMTFVRTIFFDSVSGGDISADGSRIVLRRESAAMEWYRCEGETIATAVSRAGKAVPLPSLNVEANGEAIAYMPDRSGYFTTGEGARPGLFFVGSRCPRPPVFRLELVSRQAFEGAVVNLMGEATGFPAPTYSWRFQGQVIPGATSNVLRLQVTATNAGLYELVASNQHGVAISSAQLTTGSKPLLMVTEVQSSTAPSPNLPSGDWWELTSFENEPVDITGWRFNDASGDFTDAYTITNRTIIQPGESIVLVEGLTAAEFRAWWGGGLPQRTQVVRYSGSGLSLAAGGDSIRLWTATTTDLSQTVARADFGTADSGVTFNFDPVNRVFGQKSQLGVNGVVRAAGSTDIGSPGRIRAQAPDPELEADYDGFQIRMTFQKQVGSRYQLQRAPQPQGPWENTGQVLYSSSDGVAEFTAGTSDSSGFFRLLVD